MREAARQVVCRLADGRAGLAEPAHVRGSHFKLARDGLGQRLHEEAADLHQYSWLRHRCGGVEQG